MIPLFTRPRQARPRQTPAQLAQTFKHVRLTQHVASGPATGADGDYSPRHCNGLGCSHQHLARSRPQPGLRPALAC